MTDDPTPTAEQVATEAIRVACFEAPKATSSTEWRSRIERILSDYRSALRSSPEALADLNGGEWVQPTGPGGITPHWQPNADFRVMLALPEEQPPPDTRPLFVFVPREATDG